MLRRSLQTAACTPHWTQSTHLTLLFICRNTESSFIYSPTTPQDTVCSLKWDPTGHLLLCVSRSEGVKILGCSRGTWVTLHSLIHSSTITVAEWCPLPGRAPDPRLMMAVWVHLVPLQFFPKISCYSLSNHKLHRSSHGWSDRCVCCRYVFSFYFSVFTEAVRMVLCTSGLCHRGVWMCLCPTHWTTPPANIKTVMSRSVRILFSPGYTITNNGSIKCHIVGFYCGYLFI